MHENFSFQTRKIRLTLSVKKGVRGIFPIILRMQYILRGERNASWLLSGLGGCFRRNAFGWEGNIEIVAKHAISSLEELSNAIEVFEKNIENMKKVKRDIDKETVLNNIPNLPGI